MRLYVPPRPSVKPARSARSRRCRARAPASRPAGRCPRARAQAQAGREDGHRQKYAHDEATPAERDTIDAYAATPGSGGGGRNGAAVLRAEAVALLLCTPSFQVT